MHTKSPHGERSKSEREKERAIREIVEELSNDWSAGIGESKFSYVLDNDGEFKFIVDNNDFRLTVDEFIKHIAVICVDAQENVFVLFKIGGSPSQPNYIEPNVSFFNRDYSRLRTIVGSHLTDANPNTDNLFVEAGRMKGMDSNHKFIAIGEKRIKSVVDALIVNFKKGYTHC